MTRENYESFTRGGVRTFPKALSREIPPFQAARLLNYRRLRDSGGSARWPLVTYRRTSRNLPQPSNRAAARRCR